MAGSPAQQKKKIGLLRNIDLFDSLSDEELVVIAAHASLDAYKDDTHLFSEGDAGDALYVIATGHVVISRSEGENRRVDIAEYVRGEYFGEIDLLSKSRRTAHARTSSSSEILRFPREGETLESVLGQEPAVSARLLQTFIAEIAGRIRKTNALISENSPWVQELRRQVFGDKLTGMFNQSYLDEELPKLLNEESSPVSVLMVKPDNFKVLNDEYGHDAGDATLRLIAATVRAWAGENPSVRYRGNEMSVILTNTPVSVAYERGETLRKKLCTLDLRDILGGETVPEFLFSVGIACYPDHASKADVLVQSAYDQLFRAREAGGNACAVVGGVVDEQSGNKTGSSK